MQWKHYIDQWIVQSWGMWLFLIFFYIAFVQLSQKKEEEIKTLSKRLEFLEKEKNSIVLQNQDMKERVASEKDPQWVEQILIKKLGVVPEGQLKIHFKKKEQ